MEKSNYDIVQEWLNAFKSEMESNIPYVIMPLLEWKIPSFTEYNHWFGENFAIIKCDDAFIGDSAVCLFPSYQIIDANWILEHIELTDQITSIVHIPTDKEFWNKSYYLHIGI